eukprot:GHVP01031701.1.p1 GENE.GHVP01031701.1~~GHVP01031701.1.p1  ORF type:complete len:217 (-),score=26.41 GHVP01031701.1:40-651(-)
MEFLFFNDLKEKVLATPSADFEIASSHLPKQMEKTSFTSEPDFYGKDFRSWNISKNEMLKPCELSRTELDFSSKNLVSLIRSFKLDDVANFDLKILREDDDISKAIYCRSNLIKLILEDTKDVFGNRDKLKVTKIQDIEKVIFTSYFGCLYYKIDFVDNKSKSKFTFWITDNENLLGIIFDVVDMKYDLDFHDDAFLETEEDV